jgi:hypothetical protein
MEQDGAVFEDILPFAENDYMVNTIYRPGDSYLLNDMADIVVNTLIRHCRGADQ